MAAIKKKAQKEETTTQKLYSHLYECCNILRGPINRDEFKSYITPLLFFKRISDVYDEEYRIALEVSEGDAEYAKFDENYLFQIPEGCHWKDVREKSENIGSAIVSAMVGIERANPNQLHGVFSSFDDANWTDKNKLSDERLKNLIEHLSKIRVGNDDYSADVMGDSYEFLIKKFADLSKKNAGEYGMYLGGDSWYGLRTEVRPNGKLRVSHIHQDGAQTILAEIAPTEVGMKTFFDKKFKLRYTFDVVKGEKGFVNYRLGVYINGKKYNNSYLWMKHVEKETLTETIFLYTLTGGSIKLESVYPQVDFAMWGATKDNWKQVLG